MGKVAASQKSKLGAGGSIKLKRTYEAPTKDDGIRILVERLWPRGMKKEDLHLDLWLKEVAPSTELRKWFSHEPEKWNQFQQKYFAELDKNEAAVTMLMKEVHKGTITLLYSSKDTEHNAAVCLKKYLESIIN